MTDDNFRKRIAEMYEDHPESFVHSPFCDRHPSKTGPAQVATTAYRTNYDAIFRRMPVGQA